MEKKRIDYVNNYAKENYYTAKVLFPKEMKETIKTWYTEKGYKSLNSYINELIKKDMNQGGGTAEQESDS